MTDAEKLVRDIETLKESIDFDRRDFANLNFSAAEKAGILKHIAWCMAELETLRDRLDRIPASS